MIVKMTILRLLGSSDEKKEDSRSQARRAAPTLVPLTGQQNPRRGGSSAQLRLSSFFLSSLEPKSLRMVIITIILVQVLCCHSITKITRNGINGAMFVSISPFLVIDDNTIKASIIFAKIDKFNRLIPIETAYTCLDAYHHPMMTWPPPKTIISPLILPLSCYFSLMT